MNRLLFPVKRACFFIACLLGTASLRADVLADRPARIETIDLERGTATFTMAAHDYKTAEKPVPGQIADVSAAKVWHLLPNSRRQPARLDDLQPGTEVLLSGVMSISSQIVTEIKIDERHKPQRNQSAGLVR